MEEPGSGDDITSQVTEAAEAVLVIENAPLPLAIVMLNGRIGLVNRAMSDLLGYQPGELSGADVRDLMADRADFDSRWQEATSAVGVTDDRIGHLRRRDGVEVEARVASVVIKDKDGTPRFVLARALAPRQPGG